MRVLFVCHGNMNRSALAEVLLRKLRPEWGVTSAGLKTTASKSGLGRRASGRARRAAALRGLSLEEHRSRQLTQAMLDEADLVVYMDGANRRRLEEGWRCPEGARCLATWGDDGLQRVQDPAFLSEKEQAHELALIWDQIERCVQRLAEEAE